MRVSIHGQSLFALARNGSGLFSGYWNWLAMLLSLPTKAQCYTPTMTVEEIEKRIKGMATRALVFGALVGTLCLWFRCGLQPG
jgi:hypothetical protein